MALSLLPRIHVGRVSNVSPRGPEPRGETNMLLEGIELFFARHLKPRQMPSGSGEDVALLELRLGFCKAIHAVTERACQQSTKVWRG